MIQQGSKFRLITDYPIAIDSPDHLYPFGVKENNNHSQTFTNKLRELYPKPLSLLDLGTAGGNNVLQHNLQGDNACGLEGSDYRKVRGLPEWNKESNLFTCDITKPFQIYQSKKDECTNLLIGAKFDCISMWECLEHLKEEDLSVLYTNVKNHLKKDGIFLGSICVFDQERCDRTKGIEWGRSDEYPRGNLDDGPWRDQPLFYHQNIKPREWWWYNFEQNGFKIRWDLIDFFGKDVVRGPGVGCGEDCTINFYLELLKNGDK